MCKRNRFLTLILFVLSGATLVLSGCHTISGAGHDVSDAGKSVEKTADKHTP